MSILKATDSQRHWQTDDKLLDVNFRECSYDACACHSHRKQSIRREHTWQVSTNHREGERESTQMIILKRIGVLGCQFEYIYKKNT